MSSASSEAGTGKTEANHTSTKHGWSPAAAFALVLISFIALPWVADILRSTAPQLLFGWSVKRITAWLETPPATFWYVLLAEVMTVGLFWWFIRRRKRVFSKAVALGRRPNWRDAGYAVGGILAYFGLYIVTIVVLTQLIPINTEQEQATGFPPHIQGLDLGLAFTSLVILPPIAEEIVFRGFLFGTLRAHRVSLAWASSIVSLLFATLHLFGSADGGLLWIAFVDTFVLSLVLCYAREKTGAIWASIAIHALKNGFVFLNLFVLGVS